jgi:chromosome segregation ATPase
VDFVPDGTRAGRDNHLVDSALLETAAALEARDAELEAALEPVEELSRRAAHVHERALALERFLAGAPVELAGLEREEVEARERRTEADRALAAAERTAEEVSSSRRASDEKRAQAERALVRAREAAADAAAHIERVLESQRRLLAEEQAARGEATLLAHEAADTTAAVRELPRVSDSGRTPPGDTLPDLAAWADRVEAALLVVRGGLIVERERLLREAGELAAAALGEPLYGASVSMVLRRLEERSRAS